jgi:hypothetical protein
MSFRPELDASAIRSSFDDGAMNSMPNTKAERIATIETILEEYDMIAAQIGPSKSERELARVYSLMTPGLDFHVSFLS